MARTPKPYKRITPFSRDLARGLESYWLGADHLLRMSKNSFTEDYQRFAYSDIQAVIIERRRYRLQDYLLFALLIAGILVPVTVGLMYLISGLTDWPLWITWLPPVLGFALLWSGLRLVSGPPCRAFLQTAVQTVPLAPLTNLRRCRRFLKKLRPRLAAAQGELAAADLAAHAEALQAAGIAVHAATPAPVARKRVLPPPARLTRGWLHLSLYILLLLDAVLTGIDFFGSLRGTAATVLGTVNVLVLLAAIVIIVVALIRQHHPGFPFRLKALTWGITGYIVLWLILYFIQSFLAESSAAVRTTMPQVMAVASMIISALGGVLGTWWFIAWRRTRPFAR